MISIGLLNFNLNLTLEMTCSQQRRTATPDGWA